MEAVKRKLHVFWLYSFQAITLVFVQKNCFLSLRLYLIHKRQQQSACADRLGFKRAKESSSKRSFGSPPFDCTWKECGWGSGGKKRGAARTRPGFRVSHSLSSPGPLPAVSKGTLVIVPLVGSLEDGRWEAALVKQEGSRIQLSVNSPATAAVGRYQLTVETTCTGGHAVSTYNPANDVSILFNPWCEGKTLFFNRFSCFDALLFL